MTASLKGQWSYKSYFKKHMKSTIIYCMICWIRPQNLVVKVCFPFSQLVNCVTSFFTSDFKQTINIKVKQIYFYLESIFDLFLENNHFEFIIVSLTYKMNSNVVFPLICSKLWQKHSTKRSSIWRHYFPCTYHYTSRIESQLRKTICLYCLV